jgi:hypothetical protein
MFILRLLDTDLEIFVSRIPDTDPELRILHYKRGVGFFLHFQVIIQVNLHTKFNFSSFSIVHEVQEFYISVLKIKFSVTVWDPGSKILESEKNHPGYFG